MFPHADSVASRVGALTLVTAWAVLASLTASHGQTNGTASATPPAALATVGPQDGVAASGAASSGGWLRPKPDSAALAITAHAETKLALEQAIAIALARNPQVLRAITEIERLNGVVLEARAAALPQVSVAMGVDVVDEYLNPASDVAPATTLADDVGSAVNAQGLLTLLPPIGPVPIPFDLDVGSLRTGPAPPNTDKAPNESWQVEIVVAKNLFDGWATRASIAQAQLVEEASTHDFEEVCLDTILAVRQLFYDALYQRGRIVVEEESVALLREDLQDQTRRFDAGTVPRFNVLRAEVAVFNELPKLIEAKNAYRNSLDRLAKILAVDYVPGTGEEFTPFEPVGELQGANGKLDLTESIHRALMDRPLLKALQNRIEAERKGYVIARSGWLPRFDARASYLFQNDPFWDAQDRTDSGYTAGVAGQWDVFDGFATLGRVRQSRQLTRSAELQFEDDRRQVELDTRVAFSRYIASLEFIRSQEKNVELAAESLRLARSRFDSGAGTQLDVLDARVQLTQAALNELNARYQYQLARADMDRATAAGIQFIATPGQRRAADRVPVIATSTNATAQPVPPAAQAPAPARKPNYQSKPR
ncbi:MAG: TolC family protein [Verrucomicrobiae bacterium]|nr:TolC family protein [Verrucomicrobiae bacterium]